MSGIKHKFVSAMADWSDAGIIKPSNWNDTHKTDFSTGAVIFTGADVDNSPTVDDTNFHWDNTNKILKLNDYMTKYPIRDIRNYLATIPIYDDTVFTSAIIDIGSANITLYVPSGIWNINNNITIPSNINLKIEKGAILNIASGKIFTINGQVDIGPYLPWSGAGSVVSTDTTNFDATIDPYPSSTKTPASSLRGDMQELRFQVAQILGDNWHKRPVGNLTEIYNGKFNWVSKTSDYTATISDFGIYVTASTTNLIVSLPSATLQPGKMFLIFKADNTIYSVTINCYSAEKIKNSTTKILSAQYEYIWIQSDGANWQIISEYTSSPVISNFTKAIHNHSNNFNGGLLKGKGLVRVGLASDQTGIPNTTETKINLNSIIFDSDGWFDISNFKFQPPISGYYRFYGQYRITRQGNYISFYAYLYKNGSVYSSGKMEGTSHADLICLPNVEDIIFLNGSTDYVEFYMKHYNATASSVEANTSQTYLTIEFIGS